VLKSVTEYYQEDSIVAIYTDVVKRLLIALDDGEQSLAPEPVSSPLMTQDEDNTWPPWPWPPWGGDNEDSDSKPVDFDKLAKSVVRFETKLANASLDL
jgi:endothelin-converting enzyme